MNEIATELLEIVAKTGRFTLQAKDNLFQLYAFIVNVFRAGASKKWLNDATMLVLIRQIYFTGVQPLGLAIFVALISGSAIVNLVITALTSIDAKHMIGPVVVFLFFKELAPLLSTIIIFIRSCPAIVSELALMKITNEIQTLHFMDIDPYNYLFFPRMIAVVVSNFILSIIICFMALVGGFLVMGFIHYMRFSDYLLLLTREIGIDDFLVFALKVLLFGIIVGGAAMYRAIKVEPAFTSVPVVLIKTLVSLLIYLLIIEGIFAIVQTKI